MDPHQRRKEKRGNWQHGYCAGLSLDELAALADLWEHQSNKSNVMFFCSVCKPKVALAMKFFRYT